MLLEPVILPVGEEFCCAPLLQRIGEGKEQQIMITVYKRGRKRNLSLCRKGVI